MLQNEIYELLWLSAVPVKKGAIAGYLKLV